MGGADRGLIQGRDVGLLRLWRPVKKLTKITGLLVPRMLRV